MSSSKEVRVERMGVRSLLFSWQWLSGSDALARTRPGVRVHGILQA